MPAKIPWSPWEFLFHQKEWWFPALFDERWLICFRTLMLCTSEGKILLTSQMSTMPQSFFDETIQLLQLRHTFHGPFASSFSQSVVNLLPQDRHVFRLSSKIVYWIRDQLGCCIHTQGSDEELHKGMQFWIIFILWVVRVIPQPFNRVEWLLKIPALLTHNSIGQNRGYDVSCSTVAVPDTVEFGDEKLSHRTQKWRKYSKLCRGYEYVFCVL